jgi:hypothetical protein
MPQLMEFNMVADPWGARGQGGISEGSSGVEAEMTGRRNRTREGAWCRWVGDSVGIPDCRMIEFPLLP